MESSFQAVVHISRTIVNMFFISSAQIREKKKLSPSHQTVPSICNRMVGFEYLFALLSAARLRE